MRGDREGGGRITAEQYLERLAGDVLVRDEWLSVVFTGVDERGHVGMTQAGDEVRLASHALAKLFVATTRRDDLDGDEAIVVWVACHVHGAHASGTQATYDLEATDFHHSRESIERRPRRRVSERPSLRPDLAGFQRRLRHGLV